MQQPERGSKRREQILSTAMEMFGEVGYRGTSLRDISARVGITHPGLLYHFHSKEELLMAVLARRDRVNIERFGLVPGVSGRDMVRRLIGNIAANVNVPGIIELFTTLVAEATDPEHPAHDYFLERYQAMVGGTEMVIDALEAEGELNGPLDHHATAVEIVALMEGLQLQWLYYPDVPMVRILVERINSFLTRPFEVDGDWASLDYVLSAEQQSA